MFLIADFWFFFFFRTCLFSKVLYQTALCIQLFLNWSSIFILRFQFLLFCNWNLMLFSLNQIEVLHPCHNPKACLNVLHFYLEFPVYYLKFERKIWILHFILVLLKEIFCNQNLRNWFLNFCSHYDWNNLIKYKHLKIVFLIIIFPIIQKYKKGAFFWNLWILYNKMFKECRGDFQTWRLNYSDFFGTLIFFVKQIS